MNTTTIRGIDGLGLQFTPRSFGRHGLGLQFEPVIKGNPVAALTKEQVRGLVVALQDWLGEAELPWKA